MRVNLKIRRYAVDVSFSKRNSLCFPVNLEVRAGRYGLHLICLLLHKVLQIRQKLVSSRLLSKNFKNLNIHVQDYSFAYGSVWV
jgi:hypothetical protein